MRNLYEVLNVHIKIIFCPSQNSKLSVDTTETSILYYYVWQKNINKCFDINTFIDR